MARTQNKLVASRVATAKGPALLSDGGRLYLAVDPRGNRRFVYIYARGGKQHELSLGPYPDLSLAGARQLRDKLNSQLAAGETPASPRRRKEGAETFGQVAEEEIKRRAPSWRSKVSAGHWAISIQKHCKSLLGRPIISITAQDVQRVLAALNDTCPAFAPITRARIANVFDYAAAQGYLPLDAPNPADSRRLARVLPAAPKPKHHAALPYRDVPDFCAELRAIPRSDARYVAARAAETIVLTACRVREVTNAVWSEVDFERRLLSIPAQRMKAGVAHQVPLCARALAILREMVALREGEFVFPGGRAGRPIANSAPGILLKRLRPGSVPHGFRSSFRDWAGDHTAFPREVCEAALAHVVGGVEGSYRRGSALEKGGR